ncbi:hypothetical protein NA78x_003980 [Anatilimnocola sp. NA78]|uniref:hypothetical protein n=1 Tax=Anatilimnocola sp. NA78 TaxID=3415683 RepID=UPI003CE58F7F
MTNLHDRSSSANTMTATNHSESKLERAEPELSQYRAISPWAVATLIAGIAAPLALVGPLLWWVPLLAIPLALLASRQLQRGDPPYVGKKAAVIGICLSMLFLGWAVSQRLSREIHATTEAQRFVDSWLDLLRAGKLHESHQVLSPPSRRTPVGTDLDSYYKASAEPAKELDVFVKNPAVVALTSKDPIELAPGEITQHVVDANSDYFTFRYEITRGTVPGSSGSVWIGATRERSPISGAVEWQVSSITVTEPTK